MSDSEKNRLAARARRYAKVGTKVATYHGFGGEIPIGYRSTWKEIAGTGLLEVWTKVELSNGEPVG